MLKILPKLGKHQSLGMPAGTVQVPKTSQYNSLQARARGLSEITQTDLDIVAKSTLAKLTSERSVKQAELAALNQETQHVERYLLEVATAHGWEKKVQWDESKTLSSFTASQAMELEVRDD